TAAKRTRKKPNLFAFNAWTKKYGQSVDINNWMKNNPHPYGQRFDPGRSYLNKRYVTTLGPLGIRTKMFDQDWVRRYKLQDEAYPEYLKSTVS
ncbi:MAG: hypothetical protein HRT88_20655, partial [Lentisphaeraceae bacterium]|nr:hypothetical protein [Lentisphaeraceae bacterium]